MKKFKFNIRGNDYDVEIKEFENNIAEVEVNGTVYKVELKAQKIPNKTPKLVRAHLPIPAGASEIKKSQASSAYTVKAPLPGNILQLKVKEGDVIKKGDLILVMEAMKMENNILSEKPGTVTAIRTSIGSMVLQGDPLVDIV